MSVSFRQQLAECEQGVQIPYCPSMHAHGDCYLPKARHGSDSDRDSTLRQNTFSLDYREHPKEADLMDRTADAVGSNKFIQKAPLDPGKLALDWMASLLMTLISIVSRSLQVFSRPFRISENTEATSILVN